MPLVAHNELPTFARLRDAGQEVLSRQRAEQQDIRELHIGLLNMMPDAALTATELQFIRLVGSCNQIAQFYVYPFSLPELNRTDQAERHIASHYSSFDALCESGLDALVISGAIVEWAMQNVASILCSCLATHALVKYLHGIDRQRLPQKQWGVYSHTISYPEHPLVRDINTRFDAPHSRYNEVTKAQLESAGIKVLVESEQAGVHLAVSPDLFRVVYFQGHPEYDAISLLKEYKREVNRFIAGELDAPPPFPEHYFSMQAERIAARHVERVRDALSRRPVAPEFPEAELAALVDNTWGDTGKAIVNNWLGQVYQLTNIDRKQQFMPGIDPQDPLGIHARQGTGHSAGRSMLQV